MRNKLFSFGSLTDDAEGCLARILTAIVLSKLLLNLSHFRFSKVFADREYPSALGAPVSAHGETGLIEREHFPLFFHTLSVSHGTQANSSPVKIKRHQYPMPGSDKV
jgi:hypothetical protein